ncbi:hypothetical protein C2G38_2293685 [Gigaspora rosea]|uniref:Kelch-like protein 17 n=1 Tax=Gigaspora rosea TaxID=44941 RepID=A0A397TZF7_9GLOM|nr:hypothetical protein C2G38_2293685 [Gigaspora rosea]
MTEFFQKLSQDFTHLLENEYGYDTIVEVGEQQNTRLFKVHSAILYQRSPYFRQKLTNTNKKNNAIQIKLPQVSAETFNIIIKYIYGGVISLENFEPSVIFNLLITVNEFMISELVNHFQDVLINDNASWLRLNFSRVYQISFLIENFKSLQKFCNDILVKHPRMIFDSDDFTILQENALIALLKNDDLQMEESEIWDKVILWGKTKTSNLPPNLKDWTNDNFKSLKTTLQHCLPHIRYFQIPGEDVLDKVKPYHDILEQNMWDDIMSKLIAPNRPITSLILPPRNKTTVQLPHRKSSIIIPSSSIITLQHAAEISSWIDRSTIIYDTTKIPYEFKLLIRGNRDGFTGEVFYRLSDNIPGTIVILKVTGTDEILGGYNPLFWKSDTVGVQAETADSFIFSLKNGNMNQSILSRVKNASSAIFCCSLNGSNGPWFGKNDLGCYDDFKKWYQYSNGFSDYGKIRSIGGEFSIDEYEVFQICKI